MFAGRVWRDNGLAAMAFEPTAQARGIVGPVGEEPPWRGDVGQELRRGGDIGDIAGGQQEGDRPSQGIGQGVDLGRAPAARAADGVTESPPFAPAAERCALM